MTEYQECRERWWYYPGRDKAGIGVNLVPRVLSYKQREPGNEVELEFRPLRSKRILGDPGAATILVKNLETLPQCWFGITVLSVLQNTRGSTLGRERAHYSENKSVRSKNLENFPENSRETVSGSTICDEYCSRDESIFPTSCPWVSDDVLIIMNLSQQQLWFVLTLLATRVTNINFLLTISTYF